MASGSLILELSFDEDRGRVYSSHVLGVALLVAYSASVALAL